MNKEGADQPVHPRILIRTFVVHCLDSIITKVAIFVSPRFELASIPEQVGLILTWSHISEDRIL